MKFGCREWRKDLKLGLEAGLSIGEYKYVDKRINHD